MVRTMDGGFLGVFGSGTQAIYGLTLSTAYLVGLVCEVIVLVAVATVVRRHRPDAYSPMLAWAVMSLAWTLLSRVLFVVSGVVAGREGVDMLITAQTIHTAIGAVVQVALALLFVRGIARLAQPPRPVVVDSGVPYR